MNITEAERGMLLSKMADDTVASIFDKSVAWVRKARAWLAERQAEDVARWNAIGGEVAPPKAKIAGKRVDRILVDDPLFISSPSNPVEKSNVVSRKPRAVRNKREEVHHAQSPSPRPDAPPEPVAPQPQLQPVAAAQPVDGDQAHPGHERDAAWPANLAGEPLASWLVENSTLDFDEIADRTGLTLARVQAIADGEDEDEAPDVPVILTPAAAARFEEAPGDARTAPPSRVSPRRLPVKPEAEKPATRPPVRRRDRDPRLTHDLLRYVGWFVAANWSWREISELFEIEADVLEDALTPQPLRA